MSNIQNSASKMNGHDADANGKFAVHNIYVKDLSFEAPQSPHVFNTEW